MSVAVARCLGWVIGSLTISWGASSAWAKELAYKPLEIATQGVERVVVSLPVGSVRLRSESLVYFRVTVLQRNPDGAQEALRSRFDEWGLVTQSSNRQLAVQVQGPADRVGLEPWLRAKATPEFHVEIVGPSLPVDVSLQSGELRIEKWNAEIRASVLEGKTTLIGGEGGFALTGQNVDFLLEGRKGRGLVDLASGRVQVRGHVGRLLVENFLGESSLHGVEGPVELRTFRGRFLVEKGQGSLDVAIANGSLRLNQFEGNLKGTLEQGSLSGTLLKASEIRLVSKEGAVQLDLPGSAASLNLSSVEGSIAGPNYLRSEVLAGRRVLRGRLKGEHDGLVVIKSDSGPIRVR